MACMVQDTFAVWLYVLHYIVVSMVDIMYEMMRSLIDQKSRVIPITPVDFAVFYAAGTSIGQAQPEQHQLTCMLHHPGSNTFWAL